MAAYHFLERRHAKIVLAYILNFNNISIIIIVTIISITVIIIIIIIIVAITIVIMNRLVLALFVIMSIRAMMIAATVVSAVNCYQLGFPAKELVDLSTWPKPLSCSCGFGVVSASGFCGLGLRAWGPVKGYRMAM